MFTADSHTHSVYSFDGHNTPHEMCVSAIQSGVQAFAITDHVDLDCILAGIYPAYDAVGARRAIEDAAAQYAGQVSLVYGVELGQPSLCPDEARAFLAENPFDFVIGSCHNLCGVPDFYFIRFEGKTEAQMASLFRRSLAQLTETAAFPGIHTIAHPIYPFRYMARSGRSLPLDAFEKELRLLFRVMRESGVAMELNVKAIRTGEEPWALEDQLLKMWYAEGGRTVTCGTDAHKASDVGGMIAEGYAHLRAAGFTSVLVPAVGGPREIPLCDNDCI